HVGGEYLQQVGERRGVGLLRPRGTADGRLDRSALVRDRFAKHDLLPEHRRGHSRGYGRRVGAAVSTSRLAVSAPRARQNGTPGSSSVPFFFVLAISPFN